MKKKYVVEWRVKPHKKIVKNHSKKSGNFIQKKKSDIYYHSKMCCPAFYSISSGTRSFSSETHALSSETHTFTFSILNEFPLFIE